jgi:hypothetical protein
MFSANRRTENPALLAAVLVWTGVALGQAPGGPAGSPANPQQSPPSAMEMTITSVPPVGADGKIYVNENCAILPDLSTILNKKEKKDVQYDPAVCHVEGAANSQHQEEDALGSVLERVRVEVREQEFVLENITMKPVVFFVLVPVPKGWVVDSDPQPKEMRDDVAIFEAHAAGGEIVHLHVGVRHTKDLKP